MKQSNQDDFKYLTLYQTYLDWVAITFGCLCCMSIFFGFILFVYILRLFIINYL